MSLQMSRFLAGLLCALAMFSLSVSVDSELRTRRSGITDCFCMTFKCRWITVAEHPLLVLRHPTQTTNYLSTATRWE